MFRSKKDVDRHVKDIFLKLKNEEEKNFRCYNIAKLYYQVGDYESAKRYVSNYLEIRDGSVAAHKLLGQTLEALGQKEAALTQYKISLELESRQDDLVLKVCELLADMDVSMDVNRVRYWVERADKLFPHDPIVFQLKEKLLTVERPNDSSEDLEALIASELSARPTDVHLRVKLLKHYIAKHRLDDAYKHAAGVEAMHNHRNSIVWYQSLSELLAKCKDTKQSDWTFWILYISVLERYAALCLKEQGNEIKKTIPEATQAVFNFDQICTEFKSKSFSNDPTFIEQMLLHMWGQLHFHLACLLLRTTKREQGSWSEAGRLCASLLLTALHVTPIDPTAAWSNQLKDRLKNQIRLWHREGSYRCSQAGHVLQDYGRDDAKKLLDKIDKFCTLSWRERVYQRIFVSRVHQPFMKTSYFSNPRAVNPPLRLCSYNELKRYDEISEEVWPDSLHHQIWLGLKTRHNSSQNKDTGPHPNQTSHVFSELQFSVYNLNQAAPDSLSRLDIDAFLNVAIFCASAVIEEQQLSGFMNPDRLPTLPADLTTTLCTRTQEKWWSCAYKMYSKQEALEGDIGEIRQELQRGLEVVRCIGNHGLHPALIVHLARIFHHRAKFLKEKDKEHGDIPALEARCELYWSNAVPLLERLQNNQTIRITNSKLFNYQGKEMNNAELVNALDEGKLHLAQRFVRDKQYVQAIDALQALKCPEASFEQGQIFKLLADEIVSSMPRESLTSEMRSQHIIMLSKARNCLYLTLDRLRSPGTNPKHPLNSELCTHIADIENELKRIDPDLSRGDLSRNECDVMSDESYSSAHSAIDQGVTNVALPTLTGLSTSVNMLSTPQRNTHRTPKQSSTPFKPQHQDILDLSRNRTEARPSPERLDAQIRQMIHARDNITQTIMEHVKTLLESQRVVVEKLDDLKKEIADLRRDTQRQRTQSVNANPNLEEDLYVLGEEDYNEMNYSANQSGAPSSISGIILPSAPRNVYPPLVYPSAAPFPGYYQEGLAFSNPNGHPIPSSYPPSIYPMPVLYPNARSTKMPENLLQQSLFTSRLPTQLPDLMPATNQPMQILLQKVDTPKPETTIKNAPVNKAPPVNVVITTSDTLPTTAPVVQPTLSVTIPPHYRLGSTTTSAITEQPNSPHCYQISMPPQATIPTTVNLPPLATTLTTTPASISMPETPKTNNANICSTGSANSSVEVCETEYDPIPNFVPIIPLPAEVKVTTGEEDEVTLYSATAKLFRFVDKEWKERGVGNVKLLRNAEGKVRLLMRRDQVLKICANHMLRPDMELTAMSNNNKAWIWVANDFADEEVKLEKLCIKFKTVEEALSFKEHFDKARQSLVPSPEKIVKTMDKTGKDLSKTIQDQPKENVINVENTASEKSKATTTAAVIGGFSFMSKPIIQNVTTTELSKVGPKAEEAPKVSPFAGFMFNKTVSPESSVTTPQKSTIVTSQTPTFSFGKATQAHAESTTPVIGSTASATVLFSQPSSTSANTNLNVTHSTLRRPHAPLSAASTSSILVGVQESGTNALRSENEQVLFEGKTSLQYCNTDIKQWESRGIGLMKILWNTTSGKIRLLMVENESSKICYNYNVLSNMPFTFKSGSNTIITWNIQYGKENKTGQFAATFQQPDQASQFYNMLLNKQQKMVKDCLPADSVEKKESTTQNVQANKAQGSLAEMFKPPTGSWECNACYTRNTASDGKCIACESPRPSSASSKSITAAPTTTNQIPLSQMFKIPAGSWNCTGCYIVNTSANNYCVACNTPKDSSTPPKPKKNSFQLGVSSYASAHTFNFGIPQDSNKEAAGGFTYQLPTSNDKASTDTKPVTTRESSTKSDTSSAQFVFGTQQKPSTPSNKDAPFSFGSPGKTYDFNFVVKSEKSSGDAENSEDEVVESDDIYFSPIIPLPDKIEVKTGEEDEEVIYSHRAKLYRYDSSVKEWKERGVGDIKLLCHKETGKLRLIMRRDQILKLCLNHFVSPDLEFTLKDEKTWLWNAGDYSEGEIEYMHFACRFKTSEIAEGFKKAIDDARKGVKPSKAENNVESKPQTSSKASPTTEVEVLYEVKVTPEEKAAASALKLPENFYSYKQKPDCPGCRGCREPSVPLFEDPKTQKVSATKSKTTVQGKRRTVLSTASPIQSSPSVFTDTTSNQSSNVNSGINASNTSLCVFKTEASTVSPTQFTSTTTATPSISSMSALSFGSSDNNTPNENQLTTFSLGIPQTQLGTSELQKSTTTDKQSVLLSENLNICSPSTTQARGPLITSSPFIAAVSTTTPSTTSIFGVSKAESPFTTNTEKSIFSESSKKESTGLIKPSSFNVSINNSGSLFSDTFSAQPKTTTSTMTTMPICGTSTAMPIFGSTLSKANSESTNFSVTPSPFVTNTTTTCDFGKPSHSVFNTSAPTYSLSLSFGTGCTNTSPFETSSTTTNIFETKPSGNASQEDSNIPFLSKNDISFSTLAANPPQQEAFKIDPNFSFVGAGSCVFGSKSHANNSMQRNKDKEKTENDEEEGDECENDQNHDPYFEPVVPLPDVIEVRTGEEDEDEVFCERAKLYRFDSNTREWKERGVGKMKILHHTVHGTYRLLLRREQVHKVVCNMLLTPETGFHKLPTSNCAWMWAGMNYAEEEPSAERLTVRFKTSELATKFKDSIDKSQQSLSEIRQKRESDVRSEEQDPADDDERTDDDEDEDDEDVQNSIIFEKRATLLAKTGKQTEWKPVALGNLVIYYDSNIFGEKIILNADETNETVSKTIISMDTQMQVEGKECIWTALDYALEPPTKRTLKAIFSSALAAQQMYKHFQGGLECAKQADISESIYEE